MQDLAQVSGRYGPNSESDMDTPKKLLHFDGMERAAHKIRHISIEKYLFTKIYLYR